MSDEMRDPLADWPDFCWCGARTARRMVSRRMHKYCTEDQSHDVRNPPAAVGDDLREKLEEALTPWLIPGVPARVIVDALLPIIREHHSKRPPEGWTERVTGALLHPPDSPAGALHVRREWLGPWRKADQ